MTAFISHPARAWRIGEITLDDYLGSVEARFQARESALQSFMPEPSRFERVRREAQAVLADYPEKRDRPPLFGVLLGVKDVFHVDGLPTTAGSRLPPEALAGPQADSVSALKRAGALVLGKTVSTEFAYFGPGPTRNPHNPEHTPGGSSSGSAAAVAAGLCPLALGTQTIGSVIRPAAYCGVVGFKPSYERISRAGLIPLSPSLDHVGFFTQSASGAAVAARYLLNDWSAAEGLPRPVFGIPDGPYLRRASDEARAQFAKDVRALETAGYAVRNVPVMPDFEAIAVRHNLIVAAEAAQVHAAWFARFGDLYHPRTADLVARGRAISAADLNEALAGRERLRAELLDCMSAHGLDAWLAPAAPGAAPRGLESTGDPVMNLPWTHSGLPAITLPSGRNAAGLPLGLQIVGRWRADERLLAWAIELEQAMRTLGA